MLATIEADYMPLYERGKIDALLLVTKEGLAPAAVTRVSHSRYLHHQTADELRFFLIDFRRYIQDVIGRHRDEGLDRYYVPTSRKGDGDGQAGNLDEEIQLWLGNSAAPPIALLGSYGSGKTTFLLHLAHLCAVRFQRQEFGRIPILLPLSEISSEQTLEGLLGRHFTYLHPAPGYSFDLFQSLNRLGSFVLLLDGFDEMKNAMTAAVFRYTFRELLRLVTPEAKVILTGRPTAFLTDDERQEFLHASRKKGYRKISIQDQPRFEEVFVAPFSEQEIDLFIHKYRGYLSALPDRRTDQRIPTRDEFFQSPALIEIAGRPLQLRMLFEVLPSYSGNLEALTVRELYSFFVDLLIEREAEKSSRRKFSSNERKEFLEGLAFHMWCLGTSAISIDDIPDSFFPARDCESADAVRRDLVSGSFLEVRYPARLFFPHRSIQEYLVSEFILDYLRQHPPACRVVEESGTRVDFEFIEGRASPEIIDFMIAAAGDSERAAALKLLRAHRKALSRKSLKFLVFGPTPPCFLLDAALGGDPWAISFLLLGRLELSWVSGDEQAEEVMKGIIEALSPERQINQRQFYQILTLGWGLGSTDPRVEQRERLLQELFLAVVRYTQTRTSGSGKDKIELRLRPPFVGELLYWLPQRDQPRIEYIDFHQLYKLLAHECHDAIGLNEWYRTGELPVFCTIDRIECTQHIRQFLYERFDALLVDRKRSGDRGAARRSRRAGGGRGKVGKGKPSVGGKTRDRGGRKR